MQIELKIKLDLPDSLLNASNEELCDYLNKKGELNITSVETLSEKSVSALSKDAQHWRDKTDEEGEYFYLQAFYFAFLKNENAFTLLTKWEWERREIEEDRYSGYFRINLPINYENVDGVYYVEDEIDKHEARNKLLASGMQENNDILKFLELE